MAYWGERQGEQRQKDEFYQNDESEPVDGRFSHKIEKELPKKEGKK